MRIRLDLVTVTTQSLETRREDVEDGENILRKSPRGAVCNLVENHEFATVLFNEQSDEFCSNSRKTVSVGNHKRELFSAV